MGTKLENAVAVLNGLVGDHLVRTNNGLATEMACIRDGAPVTTFPAASGKIAVLLHGIMCTESIWTLPDGNDYGSMLARDLGYTPVYVRYNSGRAIADNGAALATLLDSVTTAWPVPVEAIVPIGFSMGGLVVRSACHHAAEGAHAWLAHVRDAVYVGTPHLGAPLERAGRVLNRLLHAVPDPTTRLLAQIADLRSDGVKDLGDADLRHADRARRGLQFGLRDPRHPVPLLPGIRHHLVAGALSGDPWLAELFGDSIVPVSSGTGGGRVATSEAPLRPEHVRLVTGATHVSLAHHPGVYAHIHEWLREAT